MDVVFEASTPNLLKLINDVFVGVNNVSVLNVLA
jgi:hypothetical protein